VASKICIDLDALARTSEDLAKIANEFDDTDPVVDLVTGAIGSKNETHELRQAVEHFAGTWRIKRQEVKESVRYLSQTAAAVAENLGTTDTDLAANLTNPAPSTPAGSTPSQQRAV
jgi:uncharacterized protein YukE